MNPFHALKEIVKPTLDDTFGSTLAANIMMIARNKSGAPAVGMTKDDYLRMVEIIANDERVQSMWGASGARDRLVKWQKAVE